MTSPFDRARFVKLLGMLGSEHPGEVANAAAMVTKMLKDAGLTWADCILNDPKPAPAKGERRPHEEPRPETYGRPPGSMDDLRRAWDETFRRTQATTARERAEEYRRQRDRQTAQEEADRRAGELAAEEQRRREQMERERERARQERESYDAAGDVPSLRSVGQMQRQCPDFTMSMWMAYAKHRVTLDPKQAGQSDYWNVRVMRWVRRETIPDLERAGEKTAREGVL